MATAVETVGTFTKQALKSSQGEEAWLRFFALMGTYLAYGEGTPIVVGTPKDRNELRSELHDCEKRLSVISHLLGYQAALKKLKEDLRGASYYLLTLDTIAGTILIRGYKQAQFKQASRDYLEAEKQIIDKPGQDAVLVSAESLAALYRAYPNYFADTHVFVSVVIQVVRNGNKKKP